MMMEPNEILDVDPALEYETKNTGDEDGSTI